MKVLKIMIVLLILILSVGAVSAVENSTDDVISTDSQEILPTSQNEVYATSEASFTNLTDEIENAGTVLDLSQDYTFNNETDNNTGITIAKDNFVLNGNGFTIDGTNQSRIFNITGNNITLNDLVLINGNAEKGGAIYATGSLTLNNVTFIDNYATKEGGAVCLYGDVTLNCDNTDFTDNYAEAGSAIYVEKGKLNLYNAELSSKIFNKYSQIAALRHSVINIENVTFANSTSSYSPAMYLRNTKTSIINSKFYNLRGNITAGAIGIRLGGEIYIKNCEFINTTSSKNGGAVYADIAGEGEGGYVTIIDTVFKDTYSDFGGALLQLGGDLLLNDCEFINGHARYNGGSIYLSYVNGAVNNCTFDSNSIELNDMGYPTYGGAIFSDIGTLNITDSKFFNNTASAGSAVYAYDSSYNIKNSTFENNINPIYSFFDKEINIDDSNVFINDSDISTNNTYYATIVTGEGVQLTLLNNTINVSALPSRYDSRDWGWVSPVRAQGWMGACWTFGMTGALESALLKATGIKTDLSENNMQNTMMKYSIYGTSYISEGGYNAISASYLLNWIGAFKQDVDVYDEMGKISPVITTDNDIHIQDVEFISNEIPDCTEMKLAILKYGSLDASFCGQASYNQENPYYNPETYAQYVDEYKDINHAVSIVGWDDTFSKENFLITPPGDGAWIIKNSWGTDWGNNGYLYVSYYDKSFLQGNTMAEHGTGIIIENTIPYNKNYQYDTVWLGDFSSRNETVSYMNIFEALENDAIAAVGTYFNQSGVNYTIEIYVNEELKLTQEGISPYFGYHTIKLDSYIPIKEGDVFKAIMTSNAMPYLPLVDARMHYTENHSFVSYDGQPWNDSYTLDKIPCLKVYTVALPIYTEDLVKIYKNDSKFEAEIGVANETVTFEINGKNYTRTSDENGTASMAINLGPGNYSIKTTFNGTTVENTITVLPTLIADNLVKYYKNASQFFIELIDGEGKSVAGVNITMNINGVFYNRTTNENGTARLNINLIPGEYILTAIDPLTGLQMSYNITVLPTLNATDLEMTYQDGSTFNVTVLDGQGNPAKEVKVTFNINGVFYNRETDSRGIAKLNINLIAGEYIITSEYDGLKIANTITIKDQ